MNLHSNATLGSQGRWTMVFGNKIGRIMCFLRSNLGIGEMWTASPKIWKLLSWESFSLKFKSYLPSKGVPLTTLKEIKRRPSKVGKPNIVTDAPSAILNTLIARPGFESELGWRLITLLLLRYPANIPREWIRKTYTVHVFVRLQIAQNCRSFTHAV